MDTSLNICWTKVGNGGCEAPVMTGIRLLDCGNERLLKGIRKDDKDDDVWNLRRTNDCVRI